MLGSSAARQLDSSTDRQGGQPGGKGSHGRCAVARFSKHPRPDLIKTCGPAELQLDSSTARQVGQPGGKGSHGRCAVAQLSKHPRPDLANFCGPAELADRQLGRLGSPAAKEVMEDALWPGSRNIHALTWPNIGDPLSRARNSPS